MNQEINMSIVASTYNRSKTIEYCLKSVLNQTYSPFEILVVDDCSTDNRVKCIALDKN